jgi:hypothetical protein
MDVKKRARRLALVCMGCRGTVPSEKRNGLSPCHWCNGRATSVRVESKRPTLFTSSRVCTPPPTHHWRAVAAMSRYTGRGAPRAGIHWIDAADARRPARARKDCQRLSGLAHRAHARAGSACRRLRWLVSGPLMAAGQRLARLGRWAYRVMSRVSRPTAQHPRL